MDSSSTLSSKLCVYPACRWYLLEPELYILYLIYCQRESFMNFKRNLFVHIQQDLLSLKDEYLNPLLFLETIFQAEYSPLPGVPSRININLERFGRRNLWHGVLPKSFSTWAFNKHREESCIRKYRTLCMSELHQM